MAPKSDAAYRAMGAVHSDVQNTIAEPVPMNLRNAPTSHMKAWGYGEGYQHAHKFEDAMVDMECLPPSLAGRQYYFPTDRGVEKRIAERLEALRQLKAKKREEEMGLLGGSRDGGFQHLVHGFRNKMCRRSGRCG